VVAFLGSGDGVVIITGEQLLGVSAVESACQKTQDAKEAKAVFEGDRVRLDMGIDVDGLEFVNPVVLDHVDVAKGSNLSLHRLHVVEQLAAEVGAINRLRSILSRATFALAVIFLNL
jgi:hypothetical protein